MKNNTILTIIIIVILFLLFGLVNNYRKKSQIIEDQISLINNLESEVIKIDSFKFKNKVLSSTSSKYFKQIKYKNEVIENLTSLVNKYEKRLRNGSNITVLKNELFFNTEFEKDTFITNYNLFNEYEYKDSWITLNIREYKDSLYHNIGIRNNYNIIVGDDGNMFKHKPFVIVENSNPYSEVKKLKTFKINSPIQSRFGLGLHLGYGFSVKNKQIKMSPNLSLGLNYQIINF